jgi:hypothetical protein
MKTFKDYLKIITESNQNNYYIEYDGILKIKPHANDLSSFENKSQLLTKENKLILLEPKDLHITVLHQNYAKKFKGQNFPIDLKELKFDNDLYLIEDGDKKSIFIKVIDDQQKIIRESVKKICNGDDLEPNRIYHISLANKSGKRPDSVGHSETDPKKFYNATML